MQNYRRLRVWKQAHQLALDVYRVTARFPKEEKYGLSSQVRRAAISVPSNIAEGCGRGSNLDFARFLRIALGSVHEMDYQLLLARDLGYLDPETYAPFGDDVTSVRRMLIAFLKRVTPDS